MSSDYEHTISNEAAEETDDHIRSYRCGYSGNSKHPQPDVLLTAPSMNHALELKGPIQSDTVYVEEDDIQQLLDCGNSNTAVYLVIKFSHREPLVIRYFDSLTSGAEKVAADVTYEKLSPAEKFAALAPPSFNARVTDSGTLAMDKPSTDEWPSAQSGVDDIDAILSGIGIVTEKSISVT